MKKVIGIAGNVIMGSFANVISMGSDYADMVVSRGGVPIMLPVSDDRRVLESVVNKIDGLVLQGVGEVSPIIYMEDPILSVKNYNLERDRSELMLVELCLERKLPILAIGRGAHIVNAYFDGSIYQRLPKEDDYVFHGNQQEVSHHFVQIKKGSALHDIFDKKKIVVESAHVQGLKKLGDDLVAVAHSQDDLIEAFEYEGESYIFGSQFYPWSIDGMTHSGIFDTFFDKVGDKLG